MLKKDYGKKIKRKRKGNINLNLNLQKDFYLNKKVVLKNINHLLNRINRNKIKMKVLTHLVKNY